MSPEPDSRLAQAATFLQSVNDMVGATERLAATKIAPATADGLGYVLATMSDYVCLMCAYFASLDAKAPLDVHKVLIRNLCVVAHEYLGSVRQDLGKPVQQELEILEARHPEALGGALAELRAWLDAIGQTHGKYHALLYDIRQLTAHRPRGIQGLRDVAQIDYNRARRAVLEVYEHALSLTVRGDHLVRLLLGLGLPG